MATRSVVSARIIPPKFDGWQYIRGNDSNNRIAPATSTIFDVTTTGAFSTGGWGYYEKKTSGNNLDNHCLIVCNLDFAGNKGCSFYVESGGGTTTNRLQAFFGNQSYSSPTNTAYFDQLMHIAFTLTGSTLTFYVNGKSVGTSTVTRTTSGGAFNRRFFGSENAGTGAGQRTVKGRVTDIFATDVCLTPTQIQGIMNRTDFTSLGANGILYTFVEGAGNVQNRNPVGSANLGTVVTPDYTQPVVNTRTAVTTPQRTSISIARTAV